MTIEERVKMLIAEQLGVSPEGMVPQTHLVNDLGADSLDGVELIMEIEEEFDINIPDGEADKIQTVGDVVEAVKAKVNGV